jgi:hypothetical protein
MKQTKVKKGMLKVNRSLSRRQRDVRVPLDGVGLSISTKMKEEATVNNQRTP